MKIHFPLEDTNEVLERITTVLAKTDARKIVSFCSEPDELTVTISKLGKSKLFFSIKPEGSGLQYMLEREKIALSHRVFKDEVTEEIKEILHKAGGEVKEL